MSTQEKRKISNKQTHFTTQGTRKKDKESLKLEKERNNKSGQK